MSQTLGELGTRFFAFVQMRNLDVVRTGDVVRELGITESQERCLLSRLAKRNLVVRVQRGVYQVPQKLPVGGKWSPGAFRLLQSLMQERQANWQLCGPNAFNRYGFSEQMPNRFYVYNDCLSGKRVMGTTELTFIKVGDERLGDTESWTTPDGVTVKCSSRLRTLVDAVYDWSRFGSLPQAYYWITEEIRCQPDVTEKLIRVTKKYGNTGTIRRIGKILEGCNVPQNLLNQLRKSLPRTTAFIPLVPTQPKRGTLDQSWGIIDNRSDMEER